MTDTTGASMEKDFSNTPPADSQNGSGNSMMNGEGTPLLGKDLDHETAMRQTLTPELFYHTLPPLGLALLSKPFRN
ncbi:hypothetical protein ABVK25_007241 [Lepraria finkii]|uniref:Uncharacterized protein n=1 Tax=Lepraria finkii TaxID=1340010 RepID=A0ABR4B653_9LECA